MLLECQGSTLSLRKISLVRLKRIMLALTKQQLLTYIETRFRVLNLISRMLNYHHGNIGRNLNKYFQLLFAPKPLCSQWDLCGYILRLYNVQFLIRLETINSKIILCRLWKCKIQLCKLLSRLNIMAIKLPQDIWLESMRKAYIRQCLRWLRKVISHLSRSFIL